MSVVNKCHNRSCSNCINCLSYTPKDYCNAIIFSDLLNSHNGLCYYALNYSTSLRRLTASNIPLQRDSYEIRLCERIWVSSVKFNSQGTVNYFLLTHVFLNLNADFHFYLDPFLLSFFPCHSSWVLYFHFSHIPCCLFSLPFSLCFVFLHTLHLPLMGIFAAESVFASHLFCCFTSVKSVADVCLISYNTLIINHASLVHQPRHMQDLTQHVAYFMISH